MVFFFYFSPLWDGWSLIIWNVLLDSSHWWTADTWKEETLLKYWKNQTDFTQTLLKISRLISFAGLYSNNWRIFFSIHKKGYWKTKWSTLPLVAKLLNPNLLTKIHPPLDPLAQRISKSDLQKQRRRYCFIEIAWQDKTDREIQGISKMPNKWFLQELKGNFR